MSRDTARYQLSLLTVLLTVFGQWNPKKYYKYFSTITIKSIGFSFGAVLRNKKEYSPSQWTALDMIQQHGAKPINLNVCNVKITR